MNRIELEWFGMDSVTRFRPDSSQSIVFDWEFAKSAGNTKYEQDQTRMKSGLPNVFPMPQGTKIRCS